VDGDVAVVVAEPGPAAGAGDRDRLAGERQDGGGAEGHDELRAHQLQFLHEPGAVMLHLAGGGLRVDAPVAALLELEVLHRIGEVGLGPLDPSLGERAGQELARGTDEGPALQVLLIARLLAHEDDVGCAGPSRTRPASRRHQGPGIADDRVELLQGLGLQGLGLQGLRLQGLGLQGLGLRS
jgi:hypothetical protein